MSLDTLSQYMRNFFQFASVLPRLTVTSYRDWYVINQFEVTFVSQAIRTEGIERFDAVID